MDNNEAPQVQNEEPVEETPVESTQQEQEVQSSEPEEVESAEAEIEAPSQEVDDEDFDPVAAYAAYGANNPYQFTQEDGYVDPNQVAAQIEQRVLQQMTFQRQEARAWEKIEKKHPEIGNDKGLREIILNQRIAEVVQGKTGNLNKIADNVMSRVKSAKSEGRAEANVSRKIQKAAGLESNTSTQGDRKDNSVMDRIANGDSSAADDLFNSWLSEGKI